MCHEALGKHCWSRQPNYNASCSHCEWGLDSAVYECECGAQRCGMCIGSTEKTVADLLTPQTEWCQHPLQPKPFEVIDQRKIPEAEKLAWIDQEIGTEAEREHSQCSFLPFSVTS